MTTAAGFERLARIAFLVGKRDESMADWANAHHEHRRSGDARGAARCAFWLGFCHLLDGEVSLAQGWLARARRVVEEHAEDCPERGYLLVPEALDRLEAHDADGARHLFEEAADLGERFGDVDLMTLGGIGRAQAAIASGRADLAVGFLDEVMVVVTADEVSPIVAGLAHCAAIEACQQIFDVRRAQEWTAALSRWCDSQPNLVPYRGQCMVHRSEIMQLRGAWPDALDEARHACARLSAEPAAGAALYQLGELQRLRGQFAEAEEAYREASRRGRNPQPGMARLRLAQGQAGVAMAAIRRAVDEAVDDHTSRAAMLAACVEIALAVEEIPAGRAAADELAAIADRVGAPMLHAVSSQATGAVLLAEAAAGPALAELRRAWAAWRALDAPYDAARVRVLAGRACRALGDEDGAEMEFDAARTVFQQLGAAPDLAAVEALSQAPAPTAPFGLTAREVQVLVLVATGRTNRAIAAELVISEKTVARHVSNIFTKLGLSSRSAATAYAYEHGLVTSSF